MKRLLIGSNNKHKIVEIKSILSQLDIQIVSAAEYPNLPEVVEDKDTIQENAIKKAMENAMATGELAIADDTGLFIEALNGDPGVYSARFAGEQCSFADNKRKVLDLMQGQSNRKACFKTVVALASPGVLLALAEGMVEGEITETEIGSGGFGYDAIFRAKETGLTFGEMSEEAKNQISHRARALQKLLPILESVLGADN